MNTLKDYIDKFKRLKVYRPRTGERGRPEAPNKPCMLLAAIDLAERGRLIENRIRFEDTWEAYGAYAAAIESAYTLNSYDPFYYLGKEGFWHLSPKEEFKPSANKLLDRGMTASLDPELFELLCSDPEARAALREVLVERWFHDIADRVEEIVRERGIQHSLERRLTLERTQREIRDADIPPETVRDPVFRRLVLEAYDYRCAASGWRILLPEVPPLVDAAHLIPFSESHNCSPNNGMALTPTYHRALDRRLVAPGPDMRWHVSNLLDKRIPDHQKLLELDGQRVIFSGKRHHPARESLEWRLDRLLKA